MDNNDRITLKIFGTQYFMKKGKDDEGHIQSLAKKVDFIMKEIAKSNNKYSPTMVAVLTALNLSDALYKAQEELAYSTDKLDELQSEVQKPLDEIANLTQDLEAIKEQYIKLQNDFTKNQIELGKSNKELEKLQSQYKDVKCELDVSKDTINDLQTKLFENQIELLKTKKELDDSRQHKQYGNSIKNNKQKNT